MPNVDQNMCKASWLKVRYTRDVNGCTDKSRIPIPRENPILAHSLHLRMECRQTVLCLIQDIFSLHWPANCSNSLYGLKFV